MNNAPVFIIDDDTEELEMIQDIWQDLDFSNALEIFSDPHQLIDRLKDNINPFIIISDVNLLKMDGFELRQRLADEPNIRYKSIPFVFWSTVASDEQIKKAYDAGGHGFFIKGSTYTEIKNSLNVIMVYWKASKSPKATDTKH
jgi:CheY-like chemotaxis protein